MAGKRPRQGWIYMVDPYQVSLCCRAGHTHIYELTEPGEIQCRSSACLLKINSSHVFRGTHPYIIWTSEEFQDDTEYVKTFIAIPLTSQTTFVGLPTTYPVVASSKNGLTKTSYALVNQLCTIDGNCFKKSDGDWLEAMGKLETKDREKIKERLQYLLGITNEPTADWFQKNISPELIKQVYGYLPDEQKAKVLEDLLDSLD